MFHSPDRIIFDRDEISDRFPKPYFLHTLTRHYLQSTTDTRSFNVNVSMVVV